MKEIYADKEYMDIVSPYLSNIKVQTLKNIPHHESSNRLEHSVKVSYLCYKICKKFKLNYKSAAKAGILHDLYFNRINEMTGFKDKFKLFSNRHPVDALMNARSLFELSKLEENMILSHMWPVSKFVPKHKESFLLGCADKMVSLGDYKHKLNLIPTLAGTYVLFITNFLDKF